ncbi:flagellar hook-length control protein FliK [Sphingosinicella terrae]|uniref:flagellar hook-length control protein FliK n=1 Tax=Sphingosinicella terrae TaxID=2172047 RepID=UPI000E0D5D74|nr:flagellar hook-length control protein FliK [Sphingosinicella terrae]
MDIIATGLFGPNVAAAGTPTATANGGFFALALSGAGMVPANGPAAGMPAGMPAGAGQAATQLGVSTLFEISPPPGMPASALSAATLAASIAAAPAADLTSDQAPIPSLPDLVAAGTDPASARLPDNAAAGLAVTAKLPVPGPMPSPSAPASGVKAPAAAKPGIPPAAVTLADQPAATLGAPTGDEATQVGEAPPPTLSIEPIVAKEGDIPAETEAAPDAVAGPPLPVAAPNAPRPDQAALGFGAGPIPAAQPSAAAPRAPVASAGEASVLVGATARMAARAGAPVPAADGEATAAPAFEAALEKMGGETAATSPRQGRETPAPADRSDRTASADKLAQSAPQPADPAPRPAPQIGADRAGAPANPAPVPAVGPAPAAQSAAPSPAAAVAVPAPPVPGEAQPPVLSARSGRMGRDMGVEIARRVAGGGEELVIRLDPAELGRIHIRMAVNEQGHLRAVVAADAPAALEALRQEIGDLGRALDQAGVKTDSDSIRFDRGSGGGDNGSAWQRYQGQERSGRRATGLPTPADDVPQQPTVRANRRVDLMA